MKTSVTEGENSEATIFLFLLAKATMYAIELSFNLCEKRQLVNENHNESVSFWYTVRRSGVLFFSATAAVALAFYSCKPPPSLSFSLPPLHFLFFILFPVFISIHCIRLCVTESITCYCHDMQCYAKFQLMARYTHITFC